MAQTPLVVVDTDAADAFHEALMFCMSFAGAPEADKAQVTREVVHHELARELAGLPPEDQVAIANARVIWTDTRAAWDTWSIEARREFASAVLGLAFGPEASKFGGTPSSGGPIDVDAMVGTIPGSDCWASAGCNYDAGTGSYEYEVYDYSEE